MYLKQLLFKSFLVVAGLCVGTSAWADTTIGGTYTNDKSETVWYGWGDSHAHVSYTLAANKSLTINFTVDETANTENYQGWVTQVLNGSTMIFFMQPSCGYAVGNWDWDTGGATYNGNTYNWDNTNFRENLQGASVNYNLKRIGNYIVLTEYVTTTSTAPTANAKMGHHFVFPYESEDDLTIVFGADAAQLTISDATITDTEGLPTVYGTLVGNELNGTSWWSAFSDYYSIAANETKAVYFKNYSSKIGNDKNWIFVLTSNADRGSCTEYLDLRSDNWGWGTKYESGTLTSNYNWDTFRDELDGATVKMNVERSGSTVTVTATQIAATDETTTRTETFTFTDDNLANDAMRFFLTTDAGHLDILPECTIKLACNNNSYGTASITSTAFGDGVVPAGTSVTVTATATDGYVFNGWKSGDDYVSYNSSYTFTATADASLEAEFVAIKTSWDLTSASWAKESGFDDSNTVTINSQSCTYANGDLAGLALQGGSGTSWTVKTSGLKQGNGDRNIGILNCTANQLVTIHTATTLSKPVNGTLIGTATTGTVYYKVTAAGTFGFTTTRNADITSIAVTDMDYSILYAGDKEAYDTKVESLDAAGQAYWSANVTAASAVTNESEYNTAVAALPTVYMAAVKAQTTPGADMTGAVENANCETVVDWGTVTAWSSTSDEFHGNTHSTDVAQISTPFAEAWVYTGDNSAAVLSDQTISHTAITGLQAGTYRVTGFIRAAAEGSNASDTPSGFTLYANSETSTTTDGITSSAGLVYGTYSVDVTLDGTEDLTFGITVKDANFNWIAFKNFTLTLVSLASVSKTITSAGWATYCSPYALDLANATGLTDAYIVTGGTGGVLAKTSVKSGTVAANTGLLLKGAEGTATIPVVASGTDYSSTNKLVGVLVDTPIAQNTGYVLMNDATNGLGFYLNANATNFTVGANTAYLPANFDKSSGSSARSYYLFDDELTGIKNIESAAQKAEGDFFDLQGRKVAQPTKGLYIVNGKKVIIK